MINFEVTGLARLCWRMSWPLVLTVLFVVSLAGCASLIRPNYSQTLAELRSGDYALDPEHAYLLFRIEHLGLSTVVGRFNSVQASLDFDPQSLESLTLDGVVDVASIDLNNESLERRLKGRDWFDVDNYPQAVFKTLSVLPGEGNEFVIDGELTLLGNSQTVRLDAVFKGGADNLLTGKYTVGFAASGSFLRSDFGLDGMAALVADEVFLDINGEFQRNQ